MKLPFFRLWLFCGFVLLGYYVIAPLIRMLSGGLH